jgi:hypothetical protein
VKTLALIVRRPDHSREAFREHYEEIHSPLAMATVMEGTQSYVKHHLHEELHGRADFDVLSAFVYRDGEAAAGVFRRSQGPEGARVRQDELTFMDTERNQFFVVDEQPVLGTPDSVAPLLLIVCVQRPAATARGEFLDEYARDSVPALLRAVEDPVWCLQNRSLGDAEARFDCVTQLHARSDRGLSGWAASLERRGCEVLIASVYEDETPTPW